MSFEKNLMLSTLTKQQRIWLKDLVKADITDWQGMSVRPVEDVGLRMLHLSQVRIRNMQEVLAKLEAIDAIETLQQVIDTCLLPDVEMSYKDNNITVVIRCD